MSKIDMMYKKMDEYEKKFGRRYPLMVISEPELVIKYIDEAITKNKPLNELYPKIFGARKGQYI